MTYKHKKRRGIVIKTLADIAQFLNAGDYDFPADRYIIDEDLDFGTARINLITTNGFYEFVSTAFGSVTYTGTTPFITSATTGHIVHWDYGFLITPNATAIQLTDGNSIIMTLPVFAGCKKVMLITGFEFVTLNDFPMVGCETGIECVNCLTVTAKLLQWNSGQDLSGTALTVSGALSERLLMMMFDSRPEATESILDIQANWGGRASLLGGLFDLTSWGVFFKASSRKEDDVDVILTAIDGTDVSSFIGSVNVTNNVTATTIANQSEWTDFNMNALASLGSNAERFTLANSTTGQLTYIGIEPFKGSVIYTVSASSAGWSQQFNFRTVKNGSILPDEIEASVEIASDVRSTSYISPISLVTGDTLRPQVENADGDSNVVIRYLSLDLK